jgi:hypothetical protein
LQERILFSVIGHSDFNKSPDLVLTEDFGGVNAGMGDLTHEYSGCVLFIKIALGANSCSKLLLQHVQPQRGICKSKIVILLSVL